MPKWFSKRASNDTVDRSGMRKPQNEEERFFYEMCGNEKLRAKYILMMSSNLRTSMVLIAREIEGLGYDVNAGDLLNVMQKMRYGCSDAAIRAYFAE